MDVDTVTISSSNEQKESQPEERVDEEYLERMKKLRRVLLEGFDVDLTLNFLFKQSRADINILKAIKTGAHFFIAYELLKLS
jgi:hypothetical protein